MTPSLLALYPILSLACFSAFPVSAWRRAKKVDVFKLSRSLSKDHGHVTYDDNSTPRDWHHPNRYAESTLSSSTTTPHTKSLVLDDFRTTHLLEVDCPAAEAYFGNSPDVDRVDEQPKFTLFAQHYTSTRAPNYSYVGTMADPDAFPRGFKSRQRGATSSSILQNSKLKVLVTYEAPDPRHASGPHWYVFVAFAPANGFTKLLQLSTSKNTLRWGWDKDKYGVQGWAVAVGLVPVAVNFIQMKNQ